jgi:putative ABC transport system ATP-binding protein
MQQQASTTAERVAPARAIIEIANLTKSYTSGVVTTHVLKGIDMTIDVGEIAVILGPSGSGKSTLMNVIGGIDRADSGRIIIDGIEVSALNDDQLTEYRRERLGFVFQSYNLVPNLTVAENIEVVSNISQSPLNTDDVLAVVQLHDKKDSFPRELSGGEQQRVSIARALVKNPSLLLCDEPTGALDYLTSRSILQFLQHVNQQYATTVLMVTHNTAISAMANRVFKLRSGEIVETIVNETLVPAERIEW